MPESTSLEIVGVDDAGYADLVQHNGVSWSGAPLWQDEGGGLFAVVMADFLPNSPGPEIVVAGQSGAITLITRHDHVIGDINCDGIVNVADLLAVIGAWGPCVNPDNCPADIAPLPNGDDVVNVADLLAVISHWG